MSRVVQRHRKLAAAAVTVAALLGAAAVSGAAEPVPGATYTGKVPHALAPDTRNPTVELNVSHSGRRLKFRGPHEHCGTFNPLKKFHPRISGIKIRQDGSFKRSRDYEIKSDGVRGEIIDLTYVWTVKVSGRFVSAQKAKGRITYELVLRMTNGTETCGRHSGAWSATR